MILLLLLLPTAVGQQPLYTVEADRVGVDGMNVLFDAVHRPETTDFGQNFGPSYVKMLDGTDALVIRSCVNRSGCSTPGNPDVVTLVKRSKAPLDLANLQGQFEKNALDKIILRPKGSDEQCGVQDPRITVDRRTGTYWMAYTAYGGATACGPQACGPTWSQCSHCCNSVSTKVVASKTPEVESSWVRVNRTGDRDFNAKSTAILVRDTPPHYQFTGTGKVLSWESQDLLHWTRAEVALEGRPGMFDSGYCEAGAPPALLSDGNYLFTYDTIINDGGAGRHGWAAGWAVLNGSNPRQVLQRGQEPLVSPTMPWELQTAPQWNWTQAVSEGHVPMIGATNGLMPIDDDPAATAAGAGAAAGGAPPPQQRDSFVAWACASDSLVEAFVVRITRWR